MTTPTRAETTSHAPDCPCAWCRVDRANATMMMCAELARAMGWTAQSHFPDSFQPHFWIAPSGRTLESPPDPFTNAADNRKLVEWLAADDTRWKEFKRELLIDWVLSPEQDVIRFVLTAPPETIAEAAWRAITGDDAKSEATTPIATKSEYDELKSLLTELRSIAQPVGAMHAFWDLIFDIESFLAGRRTHLNLSAGEYISLAKEQLRKTAVESRKAA